MSDNIMHGSSDDWNKMNPKFRNRLLSELTRLKAEVENLRKNAEINTLQPTQENARLKAEVERLTAFTTRTIIPNEELQAEVERLTKAGDELHIFLISYIVESRISSAYLNKLDDDWNAAKEGKGQP